MWERNTKNNISDHGCKHFKYTFIYITQLWLYHNNNIQLCTVNIFYLEFSHLNREITL